MKRKCFYTIFLILTFSTVLIANGSASVRLYLSPPGQAYFSSLNIGDTFTLEIIAEADAPGVTLVTFSVAWSPGNSVDFVHPINNGSLMMTGFFPPSDPSRLSGIMPDVTSESSVGGSGSTPEIAIFTAPALNRTGPDSLVSITFRKQSLSYPTFSLTGAEAYDSTSLLVSVTSQTPYVNTDASNAMMSGPMLFQATAAVVNIGGNDYHASVAGNMWTLDISSVAPGSGLQQITIKAMQGGSLLNSSTVSDFIRSPGWYNSSTDHSERPADSDGDGDTDSADLMIMAQAYSSAAGEDRYDFRCDYNADGVVNLADLLIFGLNYNR